LALRWQDLRIIRIFTAMMNMYWEPLDMAVPMIPGREWTRAVDTSLPSPSDITDPGTEMTFSGSSYRGNGRSIVIQVNFSKAE
jgi:glycogen operon protein